MLSEAIKEKIELKAGMQVKYSRDCDILAEKIFTECKYRLSASTLRRLFGFIKCNFKPRTHSLDVIANYLDHADFDELIESFDINKKSTPKIITEVKSSKLKIGEVYQYSYKPNVEVTIEYIGKSKFKVIAEKNSLLERDDTFKASIITLHHPLFLLEVERGEQTIGKVIEAKVSGVTSIKKL